MIGQISAVNVDTEAGNLMEDNQAISGRQSGNLGKTINPKIN